MSEQNRYVIIQGTRASDGAELHPEVFDRNLQSQTDIDEAIQEYEEECSTVIITISSTIPRLINPED